MTEASSTGVSAGVPAGGSGGQGAGTWTLLALAPLPRETLEVIFGDLPLDLLQADSPAAVAPADRERVDLVLADWRPAAQGIDAAVLQMLPRLAFVQQPSVGVQSHDAGALAAAGVPLANVAGFNAAAVTEWTVGAALAVSRMFRWAEDELRAGRWPQTEIASRGARELGGRPVGIVGFGPIGQGCARAFAGLGCPVRYWSRRQRAPEQEFGATFVPDVRELVRGSDVLINAIALGAETRGLLGRDLLTQLPAGALVISVSRGGIVDEQAVADLLESGQLSGAAFDVFESEPIRPGSPLLAVASDRLLLSPHVSGSTQQSNVRLIQQVAANVGRAVRGEPVRDVVNGIDPVIRRRATTGDG
jgi:D-3-phosphoglycerate dehydrogenase